MQTQGSLQESDLASLLQTMQSERATGTLTLEDGTDSCALYFLFGHLFHAAGAGGEGEPVVVAALGWRAGTFHFDPRAKLPAEETIKSSPAELIAVAEQGGGGHAAAAAAPSSAWEGTPTLRAIDGDAAAVIEPEPEASIWSPSPAREAQAWSTTPARAESAPAYTPAAFSPAVAAEPEAAAEPAPAAHAAPHTAMAAGSPAGDTTGGRVGSLPIPAGKVQYEGLKSAFVDFPRLLRTLRSDRHTGYIRLTSGPSGGVLLFREGELIEAQAGDHGDAHGDDAFVIFRRQMDTGEGVIDVIDLDTDTASSLARLLTGPPLFTGLLARFVNFAALLEYLGEERLDGSIIVFDSSSTGVILLNQGSVLAAYTGDARAPQGGTEAVEALAGQRSARIEVRGDDSARRSIDVEAVLSRPY